MRNTSPLQVQVESRLRFGFIHHQPIPIITLPPQGDDVDHDAIVGSAIHTNLQALYQQQLLKDLAVR